MPLEKQYSVQFFTALIESLQNISRKHLDYNQSVDISGYISVEIDNVKKERYVLSEMLQSSNIVSESYCTKAFKCSRPLNPRPGVPPGGSNSQMPNRSLNNRDNFQNQNRRRSFADPPGQDNRTKVRRSNEVIEIDDDTSNRTNRQHNPPQPQRPVQRQPPPPQRFNPAQRVPPASRPQMPSAAQRQYAGQMAAFQRSPTAQMSSVQNPNPYQMSGVQMQNPYQMSPNQNPPPYQISPNQRSPFHVPMNPASQFRTQGHYPQMSASQGQVVLPPSPQHPSRSPGHHGHGMSPNDPLQSLARIAQTPPSHHMSIQEQLQGRGNMLQTSPGHGMSPQEQLQNLARIAQTSPGHAVMSPQDSLINLARIASGGSNILTSPVHPSSSSSELGNIAQFNVQRPPQSPIISQPPTLSHPSTLSHPPPVNQTQPLSQVPTVSQTQPVSNSAPVSSAASIKSELKTSCMFEKSKSSSGDQITPNCQPEKSPAVSNNNSSSNPSEQNDPATNSSSAVKNTGSRSEEELIKIKTEPMTEPLAPSQVFVDGEIIDLDLFDDDDMDAAPDKTPSASEAAKDDQNALAKDYGTPAATGAASTTAPAVPSQRPEEAPKSGTQKNAAHAAKLFKNFHYQRAGMNVDIFLVTPEQLDKLLLEFFQGAKMGNGEELNAKILKNVQTHLDMYFKEQGYSHSIVQDDKFRLSREFIKRRLDIYMASQAQKYRPVDDNDIAVLFQKGLLGSHSPEAIFNTMWFLNSKYFGIRRPVEHSNLKWGDILIKIDDNGLEYIERRINNSYSLKLFAKPQNPNQCFVAVYKRYWNLRQRTTLADQCPFYLNHCQGPNYPQPELWFNHEGMTATRFQNLWKKFLVLGGLPQDKRIM